MTGNTQPGQRNNVRRIAKAYPFRVGWEDAMAGKPARSDVELMHVMEAGGEPEHRRWLTARYEYGRHAAVHWLHSGTGKTARKPAPYTQTRATRAMVDLFQHDRDCYAAARMRGE